MIKRKTAVLGALLLLSGCIASTDMSSIRNPNWIPKSMDKILVWVESNDLGLRRSLEDEFLVKGRDYEVEMIPALDVFFPGDRHSVGEISEIMRSRGITAILQVIPGYSGSLRVDMPLNIQRISEDQTVVTGGRGSARKLTAGFTVNLVDAITERTIWTASADTGGNIYAGQGTLRSSFVSKTIEKLIVDGIL